MCVCVCVALGEGLRSEGDSTAGPGSVNSNAVPTRILSQGLDEFKGQGQWLNAPAELISGLETHKVKALS